MKSQKMICLMHLILLSLSSCIYVGVSISLDFTLEDRNHINTLTLECISDSPDDVDPRTIKYHFFDIMMNVRTILPPDPGNTRGTLLYEITSLDEGFIQCSINQNKSPFYVFATIPPDMRSESVVTDVFRTTEARLICPIPMSTVRDLLEVYQISWVKEGDFPIIVNRNTDGVSFSSDNTTLNVLVNDPMDMRMYRCSLTLIRCNVTRSDQGNPCSEEKVTGPSMRFNVLEQSRIIMIPEPQSKQNGDVATFYCSGIGTGISISWSFNGLTFNASTCNDFRCEQPGVNVSELITMDNSTNKTVNSSLDIMTGELNLAEQGYVIQCILHQMLPEGSRLQRSGDTTFGATLTILSSVGTPTTISVTPSTSTAFITPPSPIRIIIPVVVVVVVVTVILIVITIIIVVLCCKFNHKRKAPVIPPIVTTHIRSRIYEELPCTIVGTEHLPPPHRQLLRQYGVEYDPSNPKADSYHGSDEPLCNQSRSGGSDLSGLSGVSGNIPGAHKMPTYNQDSVVSNSLLIPSHLWDRKRLSNGTFNSGQTQSTILPSNNSSEEHLRSRSYTDVDQRYCPQHVYQYGSAGNINNGSEALKRLMKEQFQPPPLPNDYSYQYPPLDNHDCSKMSQASSFTDSKHSSSQSHVSEHNISDEMLLQVMNCLMHNRDCEIIDCPCRQVQERFKHLNASYTRVPTPERKKPRKISVPSSSTESDSEPGASNTRRANMRLKLHDNSKLHPHYHITTKSHVRKTGHEKRESRRSRSLSDLTPITETRETPTPMVGGAIKAETPIHEGNILGGESVPYERPTKEYLMNQRPMPPLPKPNPILLREISLSSDNLPVLCLNNCLLEVRTPSPRKPYNTSLADAKSGKRRSSKPVLKTVRESNGTETDDSNTSSRSGSSTEPEAVKSSQSDNDEGIESSLVSSDSRFNHAYNHVVKRGESSGYESLGETNSFTSIIKNDSLQFTTQKRWGTSSQFSSNSRSTSPFETETTRSNDGTIVQITEC